MLLLGSLLKDMPIMGLQTGSRLGVIKDPIIDPANLKIIAYKAEGPLLRDNDYMLRIVDVRELSDIGLIIDSIDEMVVDGDVIKLDEIRELDFRLNNLLVADETGKKLGRIIDYTIDTNDFMVQQLTVKRPLLKSFNDTELLIHRSQIIEINNRSIVVHSHAKAPEHTTLTTPGSYVNPFRKAAPAAPNPVDLN